MLLTTQMFQHKQLWFFSWQSSICATAFSDASFEVFAHFMVIHDTRSKSSSTIYCPFAKFAFIIIIIMSRVNWFICRAFFCEPIKFRSISNQNKMKVPCPYELTNEKQVLEEVLQSVLQSVINILRKIWT
jgi:hypothetical protein